MQFRPTAISLLAALSLLTAPVLGADPPAVTVDHLGWLAGSWVERKDSGTVQEHWIGPKGGMLVGVNLTQRGNAKPASFEFLRISNTTDGVSYFASPSGKPPVEFKLKEIAGKRVVFENREHDFPQRIVYWRTDDGAMNAQIEGELNGKARRISWRFVPEQP